MRNSGRSWTRRAVLSGALSAGLLLAACGGGSSSSGDSSSSSASGSASSSASLKVAFIETNEEAAFFQDMKNGVEEAAETAGVDLAIFNANSDPSKQVEAIQNYVGQGYKAIIISPIDENGLTAALASAKEQGVATVVVDSNIEDPSVDVSIGTNNGDAAVVAANWLIDYAKDLPPLQIGVIGALTSVPQNLRKDNFISTIEPTGATILQTVDGKNVQSTAQTAAQNLYTAQPSMNILYATGEPALIGAVAAERTNDSASNVKIFGWDLSPAAIQGIDDGSVIGVVQQDPKGEGSLALETAVKLLNGETVEKHLETGVSIVTKADVDEYRELYGQ